MTTSTLKRRRSASSETPPNSTVNVMHKSDSQDDSWSGSGYQYINPFVHHLQIDSRVDMAKIYMLTVLLLPIRVVGCVVSLFSAWMFAYIGLYGYSLEDLKEKPLSGWRKVLQLLTRYSMRMLYAFGSFHYVKLKGKRATSKEAPILVVAPHSSYVDSLIVVATGPPSIVAKKETSEIPILGRIINYSQPIYVQREDPNSRQNTIREIVERARSTENWPQVVIFAEGTCTNRSALIKFKSGAFYPGVPVQPVLLRYPNKYDSFTWTWDGPGVIRLLWLTMSSFYSRSEIEYLPVYKPSEEEKSNANLFATNVRNVMAKALGVPTSEYSFEDVIMMTRAKDMKIPFPGDIVEIERVLHKIDNYMDSNRDTILAEQFLTLSNSERLDVITFTEYLDIDLKNPLSHQLFSLLDHRHVGLVSLKSFLLCSFFCKLKNEEVIVYLRAILNIYSESKHTISRQSFAKIMRHSGKMTIEKSNALFFAIDQSNKGFISFEDFESHTKELPQYNFLYKKQEQIRRQLN